MIRWRGRSMKRKPNDNAAEKFGKLLEAWSKAEESEDAAASQRLAMTIMASVPDPVDQEPSQWLKDMAAARDAEAKCDWERAERIYREILGYAEREENHANTYKAHSD